MMATYPDLVLVADAYWDTAVQLQQTYGFCAVTSEAFHDAALAYWEASLHAPTPIEAHIHLVQSWQASERAQDRISETDMKC